MCLLCAFHYLLHVLKLVTKVSGTPAENVLGVGQMFPDKHVSGLGLLI